MKQVLCLLLLSLLLSFPAFGVIQYAGGTYVSSTVATDGTKQTLISGIEDKLNTAGWTTIAGLYVAGTNTYTSGATVTGTAGQTCALTSFNNSLTGATVSVPLTGTNTIAGGTALVITNIGSGATAAPTSATLTTGGGNPAAACSGTVTIATAISLHHSTNVLLQSAVTAVGSLQMCVRIDDNGGTSVHFWMESADGGVTIRPPTEDSSTGANLSPTNAITYNVLATKYQFFIFTTADTARSFVWAGMPFLPSFLTSYITRAGWLLGNGNDTDSTVYASPREGLSICGNWLNGNGCKNNEQMINGFYWEQRNANANTDNNTNGLPRFVSSSVPADYNQLYTTSTAFRWADGATIMTGDLYYAVALVGSGGEAQIIGQLYDCVHIMDTLSTATTTTFDSPSHNFISIGSSNGVRNGGAKGSLVCATS